MLESSLSILEVLVLTVSKQIISGPIKGVHINSDHVRGKGCLALTYVPRAHLNLSKLLQWGTPPPV